MSLGTIDRLIINSPYEEPGQHWSYQRDSRTFRLEDGRRAAGYVVASPDSRAFDDPGIFVEIPLVNQIRQRVKAWREAEYPGVTSITKRLLEHWTDPEESARRRFFFCQLEAIETLIWLIEAPAAEKVGVAIPSDGGAFERLCTKLATGGGKTLVMAMLIAWQILNKVAYGQDGRFSKSVLVIAPGLTVKNRLAVLDSNHSASYYQEFSIVPRAMLETLRQGRVLIRNWHALNWETEDRVAKRRSVDKRGAKSDEAYVREVLEDLAGNRNILVLNDEAHHAWRQPAGAGALGISKDDFEEATKWIGGLDRIHRARGILRCHDFSATPFIPSGHRAAQEALFGWIVSDFGLNDAIESGLVKTPRVVVRDDAVPDAHTYKSRLYHLYNDREVKDDLNQKAEPQAPLPDLVTNAYYLLGYDWKLTAQAWAKAGAKTPPVMITVANRTETAARVKYAFDHRRIQIPELCDQERTLHIDSKVLDEAEAQEEPVTTISVAGVNEQGGSADEAPKMTKKQQAEHLRQLVDTVGQVDKPGESIQNVISVGMLSEGWDAKTVTHIMGLRAFSSQLLCEQVVGRGLRRTAYEVNPETGLFEPEYVNVFGVPFSFLPHEGEAVITITPPKTRIQPVVDKASFEIRWPNVLRVDHVYRPTLSLDYATVQPLELSAAETIRLAQIAPMVEGKPDLTKISSIELEKLAKEFRTQRIVFEVARDIHAQMQPNWSGSREYLLAQVVRLVEQFIASDRIRITPVQFDQDELKRRLLITLNMTKVVQHIWEAIRFDNTQTLEPVFDSARPIRSTGDMAPWYTSKPCEFTQKSHINFCVLDSTWESSESFAVDCHPAVEAWVKNDHLGFEVFYVFRGIVRKYRPDFLIRLTNGDYLILETKGRDTDQDKTKRRFLDEWVRAINASGGFGCWRWDVSFDPADLADVIARQLVHPKKVLSFPK